MTLYLKGHQKYDRSKLKLLNLLNKNETFNFDLSVNLSEEKYALLFRKCLCISKDVNSMKLIVCFHVVRLVT